MANQTTISDAEYEQALAIIAMKDRQRQEEIARKRQVFYDAVRPLVESAEFITVHEQIVELRNQGLNDNGFFDLQLDAAYNGMTGLGIQVANWHPIEPQPAALPPATGKDAE